MEIHFYIILSLIVISGILGGIVGYYREFDESNKTGKHFKRAIFLGVGASLLVPLFLEMISSDLLESSKNNYLDYFVIAGFCMIASIFSSKFIVSIGDKVMSQVKDVKNELNSVKDDFENVITEDDANEDLDIENFSKLETNDREVLLALKDSKFRLRSISGIKNDTDLTTSQIVDILQNLQKLRYTLEREGTKGIRWAITHEII